MVINAVRRLGAPICAAVFSDPGISPFNNISNAAERNVMPDNCDLRIAERLRLRVRTQCNFILILFGRSHRGQPVRLREHDVTAACGRNDHHTTRHHDNDGGTKGVPRKGTFDISSNSKSKSKCPRLSTPAPLPALTHWPTQQRPSTYSGSALTTTATTTSLHYSSLHDLVRLCRRSRPPPPER